MIEIITHGPKKFILTCHNCGCMFTYTLDDLMWPGFLKCPVCKESINHPNQDTNPNPYNPDEPVEIKKINIPEYKISDFHYETGDQNSTIHIADPTIHITNDPCANCPHSFKTNNKDAYSKDIHIGDSACDFCEHNKNRVNC